MPVKFHDAVLIMILKATANHAYSFLACNISVKMKNRKKE